MSLNLYTYCANNPLIYVDPSGHIIVLSGSEADQTTALSNLQSLTDYALSTDSSGNVIVDTLNNSVTTAVQVPNGNNLIERLSESSQVITINIISDKGNSYTADNWSDAYNKKRGSCGNVWFNPSSDPLIKTVDKSTGNVVDQKRPAYIGLAHELIHADRAARGKTINLEKTANYKYQTSTSTKNYNGSFFGTISFSASITIKNRSKENCRKEEYAIVGLKYNKKDDITENDIRAEHGLDLRGAY